jgi:hypothetical protein
VNPALGARDEQGKIVTVRYQAVNAMLLNEFLKEHRKVEELEKQVEKLTAGFQKASAEVEMSGPRRSGRLTSTNVHNCRTANRYTVRQSRYATSPENFIPNTIATPYS